MCWRQNTRQRGEAAIAVDWVSGACMLCRRDAMQKAERIRRTVLPVLGGCRSVPAAAGARIRHRARACGDCRAPRWPVEPYRSRLVDSRISQERVSVLRHSRRPGHIRSEAAARACAARRPDAGGVSHRTTSNVYEGSPARSPAAVRVHPRRGAVGHHARLRFPAVRHGPGSGAVGGRNGRGSRHPSRDCGLIWHGRHSRRAHGVGCGTRPRSDHADVFVLCDGRVGCAPRGEAGLHRRRSRDAGD